MSRLILLLFISSTLGQSVQHSNVLSWSWSQGTGDIATGFHVWKSSTTPVVVTGTPFATVSSPTTLTYTDTAVIAGQTNFYVVTAFNSGGDSTPSNQITCVTPFSSPTAPTSLSGTVN